MAIELTNKNGSLSFTTGTAISGGSGGAVSSVNGQIGAVVLTAKDVGALPDTTIIPSIEGLATKTYVDKAIENITVNEEDIDLTNYYTKAETDQQIEEAIENIPDVDVDLTGLATEEYVAQKIAAAQLDGAEVDLSAYYTKSEVDTRVSNISSRLDTEYAKKSDIPKIEGLASEEFVTDAIDEALDNIVIDGDINLENYYTKDETQQLIVDTQPDMANFITRSEIGGSIATQEYVNEYRVNNKLVDEEDLDEYYMANRLTNNVYDLKNKGHFSKPFKFDANYNPTNGVHDTYFFGENFGIVSGTSLPTKVAEHLMEGHIVYLGFGSVTLGPSHFKYSCWMGNDGMPGSGITIGNATNGQILGNVEDGSERKLPVTFPRCSLLFMRESTIWYITDFCYDDRWKYLVKWFNRYWYDNSYSGLKATDIHAAIDELATRTGLDPNDYYTKEDITGAYYNKLEADAAVKEKLTNYATHQYVDEAILSAGGAEGVDLGRYYTKSETDVAISTAIAAIPEVNLSPYALRAEIPDFLIDYTTKEYVDGEIAEIASSVGNKTDEDEVLTLIDNNNNEMFKDRSHKFLTKTPTSYSAYQGTYSSVYVEDDADPQVYLLRHRAANKTAAINMLKKGIIGITDAPISLTANDLSAIGITQAKTFSDDGTMKMGSLPLSLGYNYLFLRDSGTIFYCHQSYAKYIIRHFNRFWYDNTKSGLTSTDIPAAIDELKTLVDAAGGGGNVDLSGYYTKTETDAQIENAVAAIPQPDLSKYALKTDIPSTTGLATEKYVDDKIATIPSVDLTDYAKKTDIPDTSGFTTMAAVEAKGYQTEAQVNALIAANGGGSSVEEIYIGTEEPTNSNALIWINPEGVKTEGVATISDVNDLIAAAIGGIENGAY